MTLYLVYVYIFKLNHPKIKKTELNHVTKLKQPKCKKTLIKLH